MATDFSKKPHPPVLKRFANLDIDGVEKPEREPRPSTARVSSPPVVSHSDGLAAARAEARAPRSARPMDDADLRDLQLLGDELNANARMTREAPPPARSRFNAPMPSTEAAAIRAQRAAELRRMRGMDPSPPPRRGEGMVTERHLWEAPRAPAMTYDALGELRELGMTPGVMTMEIDLRRRARERPPATVAPLELTPMAARQVQLMAWEAGVPGSGLRILTSRTPGLGQPEIDFAFDDHPEADDLVYECHGVLIMIDPGSLRYVAGRRVTWHDVPGSEGFRVG